jgi:hypothetical protein
MLPRNGITGKCYRLRAQLQHPLGETVILPLAGVLEDKACRSEYVDLRSPFNLIDRARQCPEMLALFLFSLLPGRIGRFIWHYLGN